MGRPTSVRALGSLENPIEQSKALDPACTTLFCFFCFSASDTLHSNLWGAGAWHWQQNTHMDAEGPKRQWSVGGCWQQPRGLLARWMVLMADLTAGRFRNLLSLPPGRRAASIAGGRTLAELWTLHILATAADTDGVWPIRLTCS